MAAAEAEATCTNASAGPIATAQITASTRRRFLPMNIRTVADLIVGLSTISSVAAAIEVPTPKPSRAALFHALR
jgi:hypothetical protein